MYEGKKWNVLEVEKNINIKNKILLYDFFTFEKNLEIVDIIQFF